MASPAPRSLRVLPPHKPPSVQQQLADILSELRAINAKLDIPRG